MGFFNFSNNDQQEIKHDVEQVNKVVRNIIRLLDPLSPPFTDSIIQQVEGMLQGINPQINRINRNVSQLSDRRMMNTKVVAIDGEVVTINMWLFILGNFMNRLANELEA